MPRPQQRRGGKGGQHTELRTRKPQSGEHCRCASDEADAVIRSMAIGWPEERIAASLNHMGLHTGQGRSWTAARVFNYRRTHEIRGYRSGKAQREWMTLSEAACANPDSKEGSDDLGWLTS